MNFRFLTGDINWKEYGGMFVSKRLNNGEFDYWLVIRVDNTEDNRDFETKYIVSLLSVSPSEAGPQNLESAMRSHGYENIDPNDEQTAGLLEWLATDLAKVEILVNHGTCATLHEATGNNLSALMKDAHRKADESQILYGFIMDRAQNKLGASGWDFQRGDVYGEKFREYQAQAQSGNTMLDVVRFSQEEEQHD